MTVQTSTGNLDRLLTALGITKDETFYLLNVSLGPVQGFIAEARKTRDLWVGSYILAVAAFKTMYIIIEHYGLDVVIHPRLEETFLYRHMKNKGEKIEPALLQIPTVPNHFVAAIKKDDYAFISANLRNAISVYWRLLAKPVREQIQAVIGEHHPQWDNLWDDHINEALSVLWVALETTGQNLEDNYAATYAALQREMDERKLTRNFTQHKGNSAVKCPQCGRREVVGPADNTASKRFFRDIRRFAPGSGLKEDERLCAVCLTKRLVVEGNILPGLGKVSFDSTSDIAATNFRKMLTGRARDPGEDTVLGYFHTLRDLSRGTKGHDLRSFDDAPGDWFYEEGLQNRAIRKEYPLKGDENIRALAEPCLEALNRLKNQGLEAPKYYAILLLDGDLLGETISNAKNLDEQIGLSEGIGKLANTEFPPIINAWGGMTVYSGGDDILALGPLEGCLATAEMLRKNYEKIIGGSNHCSASIVLVHHQDSLRSTLNAARNGLLRAKEYFGRNAFVITVVISSGSVLTTGCCWDLPIGATEPLSCMGILEEFACSMNKRGYISPRLIYDLLTELPAFYRLNLSGNIHSFGADMFASEAARLFERHKGKEGAEHDRNRASDVIGFLGAYANPAFWEQRMNIRTVDVKENMEMLLRISAFFARQDMEES